VALRSQAEHSEWSGPQQEQGTIYKDINIESIWQPAASRGSWRGFLADELDQS